MTEKETIDAILHLLEILFSWPLVVVCVLLFLRRELPQLIAKLADRITKAPGGFEFAELKAAVKTLNTKVEQLEKVTFEPSTALTPRLEKDLQRALESYQAYLRGLGYDPEAGPVTVFVDPDLKENVYYDRGRIVLGAPMASDTDTVFREYTHHALMTNVDWTILDEARKGIESGLGDYLPCSFNNDPLFGEKSIHLFRKNPGWENRQALRMLENERSFREVTPTSEHHDVGEIWGGAFWELRQKLGEKVLDPALFAAWAALRTNTGRQKYSSLFVANLSQQLKATDQAPELVKNVFARRGFSG